MRTAIGIAIDTTSVRAVALCDGRVVWGESVAVAGTDALAAALGEVLAGMPRSRFQRMRVSVAIGPAAVQVKRLERLPSLSSPGLYAALVRANVGRFFLQNGVPLVTGGAVTDSGGNVWAAAFDRRLVDALSDAASAARIRIRAVAPSATMLASVGRFPERTISDGGERWHAEYADGWLSSLRRLAPGEYAAESTSPAPAALDTLGARAEHFVDAYAAATADIGRSPFLTPAPRRRDEAVPRWRLALAAGVAAVAMLAFLASPWLIAQAGDIRDRQAIRTIEAQARQPMALLRELGQLNADLTDESHFMHERPDVGGLLARLATDLPDGAALVSLRLDSAAATFVVVSPSTRATLVALEQVTELASPEILGPVTHEATDSEELERATIKARRVRSRP